VPASQDRPGVNPSDPEAALGAQIRIGPVVADLVELPAEIKAVIALYGGALSHLLQGLMAYSPFLWRLAALDPTRLGELLAAHPAVSRDAIVSAQRAVGTRFAHATLSRDEAARELRRNRGAMALLVGLADLGGVWSVEEVTGALSAFADASVASATRIALGEAVKAGKLVLPAGDDGAGSGLVVLALGKHGAGELNYSSDIDLVVCRAPSIAASPRRSRDCCRSAPPTAMSTGSITACVPIRARHLSPCR
jgi:glutamate-ammonia-ligase adenylyltransferase